MCWGQEQHTQIPLCEPEASEEGSGASKALGCNLMGSAVLDFNERR